MRILAIDYGRKRAGIALSDETYTIAFPKRVISVTKDFYRTIKLLCRNEDVERIIIGLPVSLDGKEHSSAREARKFGERIRQETNLAVEYENEMFTSRMVHDGKKPLDDRAAAVFLQSYLDRKRKSDALHD